MYVYKAGVVGAGLMGAEIAQVISMAGLPVVLKDVDTGIVAAAVERIRDIYRRRVERGRMDARAMAEKLELIEGTTSYEGFADVDLVVEAVPEKLPLKKSVFAELDRACPPSAVLASNTSALSITELGAATSRPAKVVGLHFFFPAHVMKLVEVVPGLDTSEDTLQTVVQFAESLRKLPVRVNECAGFLVNRLLMPYLNEALYCVQEGAATPGEIDAAMRALGLPMGPFVLADALGLDVCWDVARTLHDEYGERMRPAELLPVLVEAGRLGEKSGRGIYAYGGERADDLSDLIEEARRRSGRHEGSAFSVDRLLLPLLNEAAFCVQEHVASVRDVDLAMVAGAGMPRGPLQMADERGLDVVLAGLQALQARHGERFRPAPLLRRKVRAGHLGVKVGRGFGQYA